MTPDLEKAAQDLLRFYAETGVDALLGEAPVDRFAEPAAPVREPARDTVAPAAATPSTDRPLLATLLPPAPRAPAVAAPPPPEEAVMAARDAAKSAATLDDLRAILTRFEGCALRATAKQLVFADGKFALKKAA